MRFCSITVALLAAGCFHDLDRDFPGDARLPDVALNEAGQPLHDLALPDAAVGLDGDAGGPADTGPADGKWWDGNPPALITGVGVNETCDSKLSPVQEADKQVRWKVTCLLPQPSPGGTSQPVRFATTSYQYIELVNANKVTTMRLDKVGAKAVNNQSAHTAKACVFHGEKWSHQDPSSPGIGEIGCVGRAKGEDFPLAIAWTNSSNTVEGARILPGKSIFLDTNPHMDHVEFVVTVSNTDVKATAIVRSPLVATAHTCTSTPSQISADAWVPSPNAWALHGGTVFVHWSAATQAADLAVSGAQYYYIKPGGAWDSSGAPGVGSGLKVQGPHTFELTTTGPGTQYEGFGFKAASDCTSGTWDYAIYAYASGL